jgi:hypothetical protein
MLASAPTKIAIIQIPTPTAKMAGKPIKPDTNAPFSAPRTWDGWTKPIVEPNRAVPISNIKIVERGRFVDPLEVGEGTEKGSPRVA